MAKGLLNPESLFDRTFRPGHPFRPRQSALRRRVMLLALVLLCVVIGVYWYLTDSRRVRSMAEIALTELLGTKVRVGQAHLSVFEGLRLQDVRVYVDDAGAPDSVLFSANSFSVTIDARALLQGRLQAKRILATDPHVRLTENVETGEWNYQRLDKLRPTTKPSTAPSTAKLVLPEILLRNLQIDYSEIRRGKHVPLGSINIEAQLTPLADVGRYNFDLQSRGVTEGLGASVNGTLVLGTGQIAARMKNFRFGRDIAAMLPNKVRVWWTQHQLDGRLDINEFFWAPGRNGQKDRYRVEMELNGGAMTVSAQEWLRDEQKRQLQAMREAMDLLRVAGLNHYGAIDRMQALADPSPIRLENVSGSFLFSERGIEISNVLLHAEGNTVQVGGKIDGYTPGSAFAIRVQSLPGQYLRIPRAPRYVTSMPPEVREIYERFRPEGTSAISLEVKSAGPNSVPECLGAITIIDGAFRFENFPYPLHKATGQIVFDRNAKTGEGQVRLVKLRGRGPADGPNANSFVEVNGVIGPLDDSAGCRIRISGSNVFSEPLLRAALPRGVRKALDVFGPLNRAELEKEGKRLPPDPQWPRFHGGFVCDVFRPVGMHMPWTIDVDVDLDDANGALATFPYPLEHLTGKLEIREGHVNIVGVKMKRGEAALALDGVVTWGSSLKNPDATVTIDLKKLVAKNVPIDSALVMAMPPARRAWIERVGLSGTLDIDGRILDDQYDLQLTLRDGSLLRTEKGPWLTGAAGRFRLKADRLEMQELTGRHGESDLHAQGAVIWNGDHPRVEMDVSAKNLLLDADLRGMLPAVARQAWDQVEPVGTLDAHVKYAGAVEGDRPDSYEVSLRPLKMSATVRAAPYRLEEITGGITINPEKVVLTDVAGKHGAGTIQVSGTGTFSEPSTWDLKLSGNNVTVDEDLVKGVPPTLAYLLQMWKMQGKLDFDVSKLLIKPAAESAGATQPAVGGGDLDFAVKLAAREASLDVGVPVRELTASADLTGSVRAGKLADFGGTIDAATLSLGGRVLTRAHADLLKPPAQPIVQFGNLRAEMAGGNLAGQMAVAFPDDARSRYAMNLVLHDADIVKLTGDQDKTIQGRLTASLALEGSVDDAASRVGRGDLSVNGKQMYRVPVLLGLLQIANLSLPLSSPISQAAARYTVAGQRITFDQIELRSDQMLMQGTGSLDFGTKLVNLTFVTDNPGALKVPVLDQLIRGVRHELLQIHVKGTLQAPKVSASSMDTFTTTIDEVFGSGNAAPREPQQK